MFVGHLLFECAQDSRLTRAWVLEVLSQDCILTALANGLSSRVLMLRHSLRNARLPIVTITGLIVGFALSGAVLTEVVFGWPGMGHSDYPVLLMGIFIAVTTAVVLVNFATDLVYAAVDPRSRFS